jgi:hypothetical protein
VWIRFTLHEEDTELSLGFAMGLSTYKTSAVEHKEIKQRLTSGSDYTTDISFPMGDTNRTISEKTKDDQILSTF